MILFLPPLPQAEERRVAARAAAGAMTRTQGWTHGRSGARAKPPAARSPTSPPGAVAPAEMCRPAAREMRRPAALERKLSG